MGSCPQCGKTHLYKHTAEHCLVNAENYNTLYVIGIAAGGKEDKESREARKELEDMETYYNCLKEKKC